MEPRPNLRCWSV